MGAIRQFVIRDSATRVFKDLLWNPSFAAQVGWSGIDNWPKV